MADFRLAFNKTMGHEGGYGDDPDDAGGETYRGVSRVYNPSWKGWKIIDDMKTHAEFPAILKEMEPLQIEVEEFYKERYWDVNSLDDFTSQVIADEMFDTGVNMGTNRAAKFLQESLSYLNRNERLYDDLAIDGAIGPATLRAMQQILANREEELLLKILNVLQGYFYLDYMKRKSSQEKYMRGWFNRVNLTT